MTLREVFLQNNCESGIHESDPVHPLFLSEELRARVTSPPSVFITVMGTLSIPEVQGPHCSCGCWSRGSRAPRPSGGPEGKGRIAQTASQPPGHDPCTLEPPMPAAVHITHTHIHVHTYTYTNTHVHAYLIQTYIAVHTHMYLYIYTQNTYIVCMFTQYT